MTGARDRRLYAWENRVVAPLDCSVVPFERMQAIGPLEKPLASTRSDLIRFRW